LQLIDDFLAGRISHVVLTSYDQIILQTIEQAAKPDRDWSKDLKLISLTAKLTEPGPPVWQIGDSAGSVHPFTSLEAAKAFAEKWLAAQFEKWRKGSHNDYMIARFVEACQTMRLPVPDDALAASITYKRKSAADQVEAKRKEVERAEAYLAQVEAQIAKAAEG